MSGKNNGNDNDITKYKSPFFKFGQLISDGLYEKDPKVTEENWLAFLNSLIVINVPNEE